MLEENMKTAKRIHFIGVGGSGMFPIVQILLSQGYQISGSDNNEGDTLEQERQMGVTVWIGHDSSHVKDADLVVYSAAIRLDNPELIAAKEQNIPVVERSEMLGYLTQQYQDCICVCGTHGKTSTTAMLTQLLLGAGLDPSAIIGGKLSAIGGSGRAGKSEIMVCEACEFVDTFLHLSPDTVLILNVDEDHLDYFKNLDNIIRSFHKFASKATKSIIYNGDDENTCRAVADIQQKKITFGWKDINDYYPQQLEPIGPASTRFNLMYRKENLGSFVLNVPGKHQLLNSVAACAAAIESGAKLADLQRTLPEFQGAARRFEMLGMVNQVQIADDYAHHPAEIKATLEVAKTMGYRSVWAVFQPFTYSRTALLLDDFAQALALADHVVMSEIMGAREENTYQIYTKDLAEKIPGSVWFKSFPEISDYVMQRAQPGDLVITLGCGDVYKCSKLMLKNQ